ncbi:endospore germination permease [Paenibacillus barcinonensis]|uniref:Endospore germination permease n=1 Tax=Paenibacillus barcinonensis TaxID=198119 RepID=A0A2V4VY77_PAEBA|nr:endospore germination permease [Paenibacillus barcinonensis]PYE43835.1 spore germination protein KB [Paenibacillus barcinonensis]QKS58425.1 endospore germination permease [Paenibacillus barcinonensis]
MLIQEKLTIRQFAILAFLGIIGDMMLIYPTLIAYSGNQDAWICSIISQGIGMGILWLQFKMHQLYPDLTLIEICSEVLGKWIGAAVAIAYLFYFLMGAAVCIREVGDFLTTQIYLGTPIRAIILLFVATLGWAVLKGLGTLGRSAEILVPFITLSLVILICCLLPQADSSNLMPFLSTPIFAFISGSVRGGTASYGELIILSMFLPYVTHGVHKRRDMFLSALLGGIMLTSFLLISLLVMGPEQTKHNIYISYILAQKINVGDFIQRIEALLGTAWLASTFVKTFLYTFGFILGLAQLTRIKSYQPLILPTMLLIFAMAIVIAPDILFYTSGIMYPWFDWDFTASIIIPACLILIHLVRRRLKTQRKGEALSYK